MLMPRPTLRFSGSPLVKDGVQSNCSLTSRREVELAGVAAPSWWFHHFPITLGAFPRFPPESPTLPANSHHANHTCRTRASCGIDLRPRVVARQSG